MKALLFFLMITSFTIGQNWLPLHLGYKYQTWQLTYYQFYNCYLSEYSIYADTIISGNHYYYCAWMPSQLKWYPIRYDTLEQNVYYNKDGIDYFSFSFNHADGDTLIWNFPDIGSHPSIMTSGSAIIAGKSVQYKGLTQIPSGTTWRFFNNMGLVNELLICAYIVCGTDTQKINHNYAPYFENPLIPDTINNFVFNGSININHHYTFYPWSGYPGSAVNYITYAWFDGYYKKGNDSIPPVKLPTLFHDKTLYHFYSYLDSTLLKQGYDFYYKISAIDRSIFPHTSLFNSNWKRVLYRKPITLVYDKTFVNSFLLYQNYPNPFNPTTEIQYEISKASIVKISITDILGHNIATLVNEEKPVGNYNVYFNSSDYSLPSGVYFYTLSAGDYKSTKKMLLMK